MNEFIKLNVSSEITDALDQIEIFTPTPIQELAIPLLMAKEDVIGQAQTGSGKTFAYAIPMLEQIDFSLKCIQGLVLCPTRELSLQVTKEIEKLAKYFKKFRIATVYGGESYDKQNKELKQKPQIVIGTPGRIIDQMNRGNLDFSSVSYLVLDEADEMLKMGFQEDMETILKSIPENRQTALFSATIPPFIRSVSKKYMKHPQMVQIENKSLTVDTIEQQVYYVKKESKKDLLVRILDYYRFKSVMIFANTKAMVDELVLFLQQEGYLADGLHGDLKQGLRDRVMQSFRNSAVDILIATDVAARGIDIDGIEGIINFDIPQENEIYVHRIGRTARAGASGIAITFATSRSRRKIEEIEEFIHQKIMVMPIPTVKDIQKNNQKKMFEKLVEAMEENKENHDYDALITKLGKMESNPITIIKALLEMVYKQTKKTYADIEPISIRTKDKSLKENKKTYIMQVNLGENDRVKANELVCFLHDKFNIYREHIGKIVIQKKYTYLELQKDAYRFLLIAKNKKWKGKTLNFKVVEGFPKK